MQDEHETDARGQDSLEDRADEAHEPLSGALECCHVMLVAFDAEDRVLLCNRAFRREFGVGAATGDFTGVLKSIASVLTDDAVRRWAACHGTHAAVSDLRLADGRTFRVAERPTPGGGRVATLWDATDDVARTRELGFARAAVQAVRSTTSDLLATLSRDLRTSLNAALGFTQLVLRDPRDPVTPRQRERLEHALEAGQWLVHAVEDALELERQPTAMANRGREQQRTLGRASGESAAAHTILYVEDNPANIRLMREVLLEIDGTALITAPDTAVGVALARAKLPSIVIIDVNLCGASGWEAARRLRLGSDTRHIPIVALGEARHGAEHGPDPFARHLSKPVDIEVLLRELEALIRGDIRRQPES